MSSAVESSDKVVQFRGRRQSRKRGALIVDVRVQYDVPLLCVRNRPRLPAVKACNVRNNVVRDNRFRLIPLVRVRDDGESPFAALCPECLRGDFDVAVSFGKRQTSARVRKAFYLSLETRRIYTDGPL